MRIPVVGIRVLNQGMTRNRECPEKWCIDRVHINCHVSGTSSSGNKQQWLNNLVPIQVHDATHGYPVALSHELRLQGHADEMTTFYFVLDALICSLHGQRQTNGEEENNNMSFPGVLKYTHPHTLYAWHENELIWSCDLHLEVIKCRM